MHPHSPEKRSNKQKKITHNCVYDYGSFFFKDIIIIYIYNLFSVLAHVSVRL